MGTPATGRVANASVDPRNLEMSATRALLDATQAALAQDQRLRRKRAEVSELRKRHSLLTPREREVLPLIVRGLLNKQAADVLAISCVTLQIHRSNLMRKMQAGSLAELVRMAVKLRIPFAMMPVSDRHEDIARTLAGRHGSP